MSYFDVCRLLQQTHRMSKVEEVFQGLDQTQIDLMKEECILINEDDQNIGSASKKACHLLDNINKGM